MAHSSFKYGKRKQPKFASDIVEEYKCSIKSNSPLHCLPSLAWSDSLDAKDKYIRNNYAEFCPYKISSGARDTCNFTNISKNT